MGRMPNDWVVGVIIDNAVDKLSYRLQDRTFQNLGANIRKVKPLPGGGYSELEVCKWEEWY
jgi:hypothetical protein